MITVESKYKTPTVTIESGNSDSSVTSSQNSPQVYDSGFASYGVPGKSAYEVWLLQGNTGTEQDFLNSIGGTGTIQFNTLPILT